MSDFLTLGTNGKTPKWIFFDVREYNEKVGRILKHHGPQRRPDLSARLKHIAEEQVPAKLKPIVGNLVDSIFLHYDGLHLISEV